MDLVCFIPVYSIWFLVPSLLNVIFLSLCYSHTSVIYDLEHMNIRFGSLGSWFSSETFTLRFVSIGMTANHHIEYGSGRSLFEYGLDGLRLFGPRGIGNLQIAYDTLVL